MTASHGNNPSDEWSLCCVPEAMWACYVSFCLERFKRKTNVQQLKEKVTFQIITIIADEHFLLNNIDRLMI